jgi:protein involved in polysaccharide export with SLBB domain
MGSARASVVVWGLLGVFFCSHAQALSVTGAEGVVLGGGMSTDMTITSCANSSDPITCYKNKAKDGDQKAPQTQQRGSRSQNQGDAADTSIPNPVSSAVPEEPGEFEKFVASSVGKDLPLYGHHLFKNVPNTFSPLDNIPVTADYMVGPGDELLMRGWGQVDFDMAVVVDRNGSIYLPKVGNVSVAGVRYQALQAHLKNKIGRVFRNFELSVTLGQLRSIQIFVVGQAKRPGAYTVSSLSTLINTLFASGGPSAKGSMRHIQVKRNGKNITELDMYSFLLKGDKTRDIALQPGDVIYIPPVGQFVAIAGSVNNPAIYELKNETNTLAELIEMSGGLSTVAEGDKVRVERIDERKMRKVEEFSLSKSGLSRALKDGDVVQVQSISGQFDNAVTLRGNVANPGRYPWKDGMRVSDLIPNMDALIMPKYWAEQNNIYRTNNTNNTTTTTTTTNNNNNNNTTNNNTNINTNNNTNTNTNINTNNNGEENLRNQVKRNQSEINWDYALVERLKKEDLSTALLPFNLGKAINGKDVENNLLLQPGDVITIFAKEDIQVPSSRRSVYVRLEGEFNNAGVYKALPGETLRQLVARAGGLTPEAYLFGSELSRETTRAMQQKRLDEIVDRMEAEVQRTAAKASMSALTPEALAAANTQSTSQTALITKMRNVKATGRIVMDLPEQNPQLKDLPDIVLEDGDRLYVPAPASTVSVMGTVYNQNTFLYKRGNSVSDYLNKAGGTTRDGDENDIYLVRADGIVFSNRQGGSMFGGSGYGSFGARETMPGDTIVVPEKLDKYNLTKDFKDWTQIFYQFAVGIASLKAIGVF